MASINISVGGDTRQLDKDIQKTVNKAYTINLKTKGNQPLGRITGEVDEFNKSLAASNARVIAFGASAGIIYGVERAFSSLVQTTIDVQKSLQEINVILNASTSNLNKFGSELFNIAKNTGQSFSEVAKAATEFSRQGLGIEETLNRTNQALVLSRLSGLDAAKSVQALTAAVNSFASQAVTASEVVNKFANVDAAFAVSSADLADAISRVGSSAAQSGVSLNELIAIVTSAQQTTARGGAVIGNSFKTIFTRLQRGKVIDLLENLGISTTDSEGKIKSTIQLLQDLAKTYDNLGSLQQADVAEKVGGVFQINILKAALADLSKEYSTYNSALKVAAGSTDEAIRRNEALNKTYAAQLNALSQNAAQLASKAGGRLFDPVFNRTIGNANEILGGINESDGAGIGATLGKGILDGLGQVIAGPGLALLGGVFIKLFADFSKYASGSVKDLLGLNNATKQQAELQKSVNEILSRNPDLIKQMGQGTAGLNKLAETLLNNLRAQTAEMQKQESVASQIASILSKSGVKVTGGIPVAPAAGKTGKAGKAAGYIPNFASDKQIEKAQAIALGATPSVRAHMSQGTIGGKKFVMNNQETEFPGVGRNGDSMVIPHYAARGFIPNFVKTKTEKFTDFGGKYAYLVPYGAGDGTLPTQKIGKYNVGGIQIKSPKKVNIDKEADKDSLNLYKNIEKVIVDEAFKYTNTIQPLNKGVSLDSIKSKFETTAGAAGALKGAAGAAFEVGIISALDYQSASRRGDVAGNFDIRGGANLKNIQDLFDLRPTVGLADFKVNADPSNVKKFYDKVSKEEKAGFFDEREQTRNINRDAEVEVARELAKDKNLAKWVISGNKISAKAPDFIKKMVEDRIKLIRPRYNQSSFQKGPIMASGYIPNFAALGNAISREYKAGVPKSKIYIARDKRLAASGYNPLGLGVFNTRDEPNAGARSRAIKSRGYAGGYIPNFAEGFGTFNTEGDIEKEKTSLFTAISSVAIQLSSLAFILSTTKGDYKKSLEEIIKENRAAGKTIAQSRPTFGQKAMAGFRANAGPIMFGAPILGQTVGNLAEEYIGGKSGRVTSAGIGGAANVASLTAGTAMVTKNPYAIGGVAALATIFETINFLKELNTNLPELSKATEEASNKFTTFNDAASRVRAEIEKSKDFRSSGDLKGAAQAQLRAEDELIKTNFKTADLQTEAVAALREGNFKALEDALNRNTQALLEQKQNTANLENLTRYFEKSDYKGAGKQLFTMARSEMLGQGKQLDPNQYFNDINNIIRMAGKAAAPSTSKTEKTALNQNILKSLDELPGISSDLVEKFKSGDITLRQLIEALKESQNNAEEVAAYEEKIAKIMGQGNPVAEAMLKSFKDARQQWTNVVGQINKTYKIQSDLNLALTNAKNALELNRLEKLQDVSTALGNTELANKFGAQAGLQEIKGNQEETNATAINKFTDTLKGVLLKSAENFGGYITDQNADPNKAEERILGLSKNFQDEINNFVKSFDKTIDPNKIKDVESANKFVDELIKGIPALSGDDNGQAELKDGIYDLLQAILKGNITADQQLRILLQNKTAELMKQFIDIAQKSFGGLEGFRNVNPEQDKFQNSLADIREAMADFQNIQKYGGQSQGLDIEKGRAVFSIVDEIAKTLGTNIQTILGKTPATRGLITDALSSNIENQLNELINVVRSGPQGEELVKAIMDSLGGKSISEAARESANVKLGNEDAIKEVQKSAKNELKKLFPGQEKLIEQLDLTEQNNLALSQVTILSNISETVKSILQTLPKQPDDKSATPPGTPNNNVPTNSRGFIPAFAKEMQDIRKGIGGAKGTDYPLFIPNLNGSSAVVNSGEKLIPNFANTGQTAVLTRDMQNAFGMSRGFIPNLASARLQEAEARSAYGDIGDKEKYPYFSRKNKRKKPIFKKGGIDSNIFYYLNEMERLGSKNPTLSRGFIPNFAMTTSAKEIVRRIIASGMMDSKSAIKYVQNLTKDKPINVVSELVDSAISSREVMKAKFNDVGRTEKFRNILSDPGSSVQEKATADKALKKLLKKEMEASMGAQIVPKTAVKTGANAAKEAIKKTSTNIPKAKPSVLKAGTDIAKTGGKLSKVAGKLFGAFQVGQFVYEDIENFKDINRVVDFNERLGKLPWYGRALEGLTNPMTAISGASLAIQESLGSDPSGRLAKLYATKSDRGIKAQDKAQQKMQENIGVNLDMAMQQSMPETKVPEITVSKKAKREKENNGDLIRWAMGLNMDIKQRDKDGLYTGVRDMYGIGGGYYPKGSAIDLSKRIRDLKERRQKMTGYAGSMEEATSISGQIISLQNQLKSGTTKKQAYSGSIIEGPALKTYGSQLQYKGKPIENPETLQRIITGPGGNVIGYSRIAPKDKLQNPNILIGGDGMMPANQVNLETGKSTEVPRATPVFKPTMESETRPSSTLNQPNISAQVATPKVETTPKPIPKPTPAPTPVPITLEEKDKFKGGGGKFGGGGASGSWARGFIPNFAKLNPKALRDAIEAESRQAGPRSKPTLGFNRGNPNQPFIYDANSQTEKSAPMDHGGYNQGVKESKSKRGNYGKNIVANMAYNPKTSPNSHSPVFNINFSPQNSVTYADGFVPNFASQKNLDYETMIANIKKDMEKRWQETVNTIQPMQNTIKTSQRDGVLKYNRPKVVQGGGISLT